METRLRHCAPGLSPRRALGPNAARLRRVGTAGGCSGKALAGTGGSPAPPGLLLPPSPRLPSPQAL